MKKKVLFLALTMLSLLVNAQTKVWTNDPQHSRLGFVVKHLMISQINGRFADFKAVYQEQTKG